MSEAKRRIIYAHSVENRPLTDWELLSAHAGGVAEAAARRAEPFGFGAVAHLLGLLHDVGKCSPAFQAYILSGALGGGDGPRGPNHAYAGALVARERYPGPLGSMMAAIIAGHHAGLADGTDLQARLHPAQLDIPPFDGWEDQVGPLPEAGAFARLGLTAPNPARGFSEAFLIRMLFSCLVDADSVETEAFYAAIGGRDAARGPFTPLTGLRDRLAAHTARLAPNPALLSGQAAALNALRARVLDHAVAKAAEAPGLFTLTVPTGGGKTLTSLSFALEHALRHGLRRVVYVIPFTSIIEQTAEVFRGALGPGPGLRNEADILEHHASFDWEARLAGRDAQAEDGRGASPRERLQRAAENWDAPVIVTTAVQFFESLFSNRRTSCRKLHNLARSVIVLDEAQTLPLRLLRPCLAALDELQRNYGTSVVLCTATQPALRLQDGFKGGLDIPDGRELAPDREALLTTLKRVAVEHRPGPTSDAAIAARFAEQPQMLCIVNRRAHAQALFERVRHLPGAVHLSTLMCPAHRRLVLAEARARLRRREPVRIVSTSLIEAGVDIDLPEVWRAAAGMDSVLQAAGRCNREGRLPGLGRVVIFEPEDDRAPPDLEQAWAAGREALRRHPDPQTLEAIRAYFHELYFVLGAHRPEGPDPLDAARLDGAPFPILRRTADHAPVRGENSPKLAFPFKSIAGAFRIIEESMESVVVPWSRGPGDREAADILERIERMDGQGARPLAADLRRLQAYVVAIPKRERELWLHTGILRPVHRALGDGLLRFVDDSQYDPVMGVRIDDPFARTAESNVMG